MEKNIYALRGFKLRITSVSEDLMHGTGKAAMEHLEIGKIYTVDKTEVHSWHTEYYFQEIPGIPFTAFESDDITTQSEQDDKKHPDWKRFNMIGTQTIDDFIKELQSISEDKRKLPLVIDCQNGMEVYPAIKMRWNEPGDAISGKIPDKMVITWRD